jgi:phosphoribosyl 1,2-cyclic phosphodiesterase
MVGDWSVLPAEAIHDAPGTLSYIIGSPEGDMLLFLTDSAYSPYRYKGVTQIAVECNWSEDIIKENVVDGVIDRDRFRRTASTHMSLERLVEMLKANDLSNCEAIYLIHLSNANSNEEEFKKTIQRATGVPVYVCAEISQS